MTQQQNKTNPSQLPFILLESCESTNTEAWRLYDEKIQSPPFLIQSRRQTQGRGTRGRTWNSEHHGNLYVSLMLGNIKKQSTSWLSLLAGLSAHICLESYYLFAPESLLHLKWPNDLMVNENKLGGLLCEVRWRADEPEAAVIGMGINIEHTPQLVSDSSLKARCLNECAHLKNKYLHLSQQDLMQAFCQDWAQLVIETLDSHRIDPQQSKKQWVARAHLDSYKTYLHKDSGISYEILDLDFSGQLKVKAPTGSVQFLA